MEAKEQNQQEAQAWKLWLVEIWLEYRDFFKAFVAHTLIVGFFFIALWGFHFAAKHMDFPESEKETFIKIHYYGNVTTFIIFIVGFIVEVVAFTIRRLRR
jgi:hypothetical protein